MHLLPSDKRSLDTADAAIDLALPAGDLVFLSFTDADLSLVLASAVDDVVVAPLYKLRHPLSVDLFLEKTVESARAILVRLLGGFEYWRYGAEELAAVSRRTGAALAFIPGDGRTDRRLAELSTVSAPDLAVLERYWSEGGALNAAQSMRYMATLGGLDRGTTDPPQPLPKLGFFAAGSGFGAGSACILDTMPLVEADRPRAAIVFYRSTLLSADTAPIEALRKALEARGFETRALFVGSLKDVETGLWVERQLRAFAPLVILNATAFSAQREGGGTALDIGCPVIQILMPLMEAEAWEASARGLGASDLAMHVVLPEVDGRLSPSLISLKRAEVVAGFTRYRQQPHPERIAALVEKAARWATLARKPNAEKRVALIVSSYPGAEGRLGHAVGLDAPASATAILTALAANGYLTEKVPKPDDLIASLQEGSIGIPAEPYRTYLSKLPSEVRVRLKAMWGEPEADPAFQTEAFCLPALRLGNLLIAVQPDRGSSLDRKADHHDPDRPPRHAYLAFYHWLRDGFDADAMIHLGTHGTLEWLPGKAAALSDTCFPDITVGNLPVLYPFIVNNPGEAAQAKRRIGAVTIGHATPPLSTSSLHGAAVEVERLIDEYAAADGLDPRRMVWLRQEIVRKARDSGLASECGIAPSEGEEQALARLDAFLCDVKDLSIRDGLHIYGADLEMTSLLAGLSGRFVPPGPSGAPSRGRPDVLPTGRNLFTIDPRSVPTRAAHVIGVASANEILRRHAQEHGEAPRRLVMDLWGSATMRTGGDDFAQALAFLGVAPVWDDSSNRVSGFEILPLAKLDRPRVDVCLKISGLFRDVFATQITLFDEAVRAVARLDEEDMWNPLADARRAGEARALRIFGAGPGAYGAGVSDRITRGAWDTQADLGRDYLDAGSYAYGVGMEGALERTAFEARVATADAHIHTQDHGEIDLLDSPVFAAHQGGFHAAAASLGADPALWHLDLSRPEQPKARTLKEEVSRVTYGRAAHPRWIEGMMRHGYQGGGEMANAVDALFAFAATAGVVSDASFDRLAAAYLENPAVVAFLEDKNPGALRAIRARLAEALRRGLWRPRRNVFAALVEDIAEAAQ